ncbi:glycosyltransferase family 2 protein [Sphaerochaeta globosa]|nr:glycosyltransferase family 2 protein [Sphaerochaeta globosa]
MQNKVYVTVVVPVYNSAKFIGACIESLRNQTLKEVEFLIINDGSSDNSLDIILSETKGDERFIIFNQVNSGVSAARNKGIRESKGQFLMFVDSDDSLIGENCIRYLYEKIISTDADVIAFGSKHVLSNGASFIHNVSKHNEIIALSSNRVAASRKTINNPNYRYSVWNKIYKSSVIIKNNIFFESYSDVISEDKVFNQHFFIFATKAVLVSDTLYKYSVVENSLSHSKNYENVIYRVNNTIERGSKFYFILSPNEKSGLFWPLYLDCLSICAELLYSFNKLPYEEVQIRIVDLLQATQALRIQNDALDSPIWKMTSDKKKNVFFMLLCSLIRRSAYKQAAVVLLSKSRIRMVWKKRR